MSPVDLALNSVQKALASFHPGTMPRLSRAHYRRELMAWMFLPVMIGAVEGGVVGVLTKNAFEGAVSTPALNLAVALLAGAPAFACVTSFIWAALNHGRHKIRFLVGMQIVTAVLVAVVALSPRTLGGLILLTAAVIGARVSWCAVITVRSTVWQANYPRSDRAMMAGKLATVQALVLSGIGLVVGAAMNVNEDAFRIIYPTAAALGLVGTWFYRGLRVRGHRALVRAERDEHQELSLLNPLRLAQILGAHAAFRNYMLCMFVFGSGNLMVTTLLVIMLRDRFGMDVFRSVLITATIPTLIMPVSIHLWSRFLDRAHILRFRAVHSWAFVGAIAAFFLGTLTVQPALLYLGAGAMGIAYGGGVLSWNLGHHDFAPPHRANQFMGVHVTLTGVRGLIAPALAATLYGLLEAARPGSGPWVFALCLALSLSGAIGFNVMARAQASAGPPGGDSSPARVAAD